MSNRSTQKNHRKSIAFHPKSINLHKFIRLILGPDIADRHITRRWGIDGKNFHEFKTGKYPVPRLAKLEKLSSIMGVNKHLVFQVASGTPAHKVYKLIRRNDLVGQIGLLSNQLNEAHKALARSEKSYRELFNQANDAIFIADLTTGVIVNCNKQAERLTGRPKTEIIGLHHASLYHPDKNKLYRNYFKRYINGRIKNAIKPHEILRVDGTFVPVSISARAIEIDGRKLLQGIFREISQVKDE
jgi:PAS domain S-box-containing protein